MNAVNSDGPVNTRAAVNTVNADGEPADRHDARCPIWTSPDPADGCTCRHPAQHTRHHHEQRWHAMTPAARAHQLDHLARLTPQGHRP